MPSGTSPAFDRDMYRFSRWFGLCWAGFSGLAVSAAVQADQTSPRNDDANACGTRNVEYTLSARVKLSDTPFGAGDGVYEIGPGRLVLRLTAAPGSPGTHLVELVDYHMRSHFTVRSKVLFWSARVVTRTESRVAPGVAGHGKLSGGKITWSTPVQGYRTDGVLTCSGSGCGMPGAPPEGESQLHIGPDAVRFAPFVFVGDDLSTFQMAFSKLTRTKQPRQTSHLALAGRKMSDRCVEG